jgi:long-chain acyl-CoA synthetase
MTTRDEAIARFTGPGGRFEIGETDVGGQRLRVYATAPRNMREVFLAAVHTFGERDFLVYEDERLTYAGAAQAVARLATLLHERGVTKGDRVCIGMRNYPEWVIAFWACQCIGAVAVTLNAWWTADELHYALTDSGSRVALIDGERWARIRDMRPDGLVTVLVTRDDGLDLTGAEGWAAALAHLAPETPLPEVDIAPDDSATMLYTSGTTGRSKGAVGTHRNHVTNLSNTLLSGAVAAEVAGLTVNGEPVAPPAVPAVLSASLQTFPFFHIGGLSGLYIGTAMGTKLVLMFKWDADAAIDLIERERVTGLSGVPTVVRALLERAAARGVHLASLGGISSGGAPVPPDLIDRIGSQFQARVAPGNGYGLTETTSAVISNGGADYFAHPDSVGRPVPVAAVRIVDDEGRDVADGGIGEVWVRGPNVVAGYWNRPDATAEAFTDGWFHTGDLGYRSPEGFYHVVDRKKDVVIRGGENVYCGEVEASLFTHDAVQDVAIIGLPHRELGEEVAAVVQLREGRVASPADLQAHVGARLARFKVPSRIFFIDEPLPRTATGKVLKRDLKLRFGA